MAQGGEGRENWQNKKAVEQAAFARFYFVNLGGVTSLPANVLGPGLDSEK